MPAPVLRGHRVGMHLPGHAPGTVGMQVDVNGVITLTCSAPTVPGLDIDGVDGVAV